MESQILDAMIKAETYRAERLWRYAAGCYAEAALLTDDSDLKVALSVEALAMLGMHEAEAGRAS